MATANYRNELVAVGTSTVLVAPNRSTQNQKRTSIIITNTSTALQVITLAIDDEAKALAGIVLNAGGSWEQTSNGGYLPPQLKITAVSSAVNGQLSIYEEVQ